MVRSDPVGHPLENPKHEKVARLSSTGDRTRIEAYMEVYGASRKVAQNRCGSAWWTASGIAERVKQLQADLASGAVEAAVFEREWLHAQLKTVITRCMQGEEIEVNGIPTGEWKFDPNNALKGIELADRAAKGGPTLVKETRSRRVVDDPAENMTDEELLAEKERLDAIFHERRQRDQRPGAGEASTTERAGTSVPTAPDVPSVH